MRVVSGVLLFTLCLLVPCLSAQPTTKNMHGRETTPFRVGGKALADWKKELLSTDASKRAEAVIAVTSFGSENAECAAQLVKMASHDRDVSPRVRAVIALRMIAIDNKDARSVITALGNRLDPLKESQAIVRLEASVSLQRFVADPNMIAALNDLMKGALDRSSWEIRYHCVTTLWRAGREQREGADPKIYETLLSVLTFDKTYLVRMEILQGLGALGKPSNPMLLSKVVNTLGSAARADNKGLAIWAYSALVSMQDGEVGKVPLAKIAGFLKSDTLETRVQAAHALGALSKRARSKVPLLVAMLKDPETTGVWAACSALASIGDSSDKVVDGLMELVDHKEASRAAAAVSALGGLKVKTTRVISTLDKMLENKDLDNRLRGLVQTTLKDFRTVKK